MSAQIAVPVAIGLLWLVSLSAQVGVVWPNYQAEQKAAEEKSEKGKSEQADKGSSGEKAEKDKSEQADKSSSKNKPRKADESSSTAASKGRRRQHRD
jgi:hypothetical protein